MAFPATYNFSYYRGDTFEMNITPKDASGNLFNLTGYTAVFTVADKRGITGTQRICFATVASANLIKCAIRPTDSDHVNFPDGSEAVYDIEIVLSTTDPYSFNYTILSGTIKITDEITGALIS